MNAKQLIAILIGGILFGFGLAIGNMTKPEVVLSFLQLQDLGLLLLMASAVAVTIPVYFIFKRGNKKPLLGGKFHEFKEGLNKDTIFGAIIFGLGWGISGLCPGSALASVGVGNYPILLGIAGMFIGAYFQGRFFGKINKDYKNK